MTAQTPERIIIDGRPHALYAKPLYRLLASRRMDLIDDSSGFSTACHRRYVGTWEIRNGTLYLVHLNMVVPDEEPLTPLIRQRLFRAVPCTGFPIKADWFNGQLRIPIGPKLVQGFQGWSSWYTRERVITCRQGRVVRDREVNTLAILEWALRRRNGLKESLDPEDTPGGPLAWITDDDYDHLRGDWWPPDYRPAAA